MQLPLRKDHQFREPLKVKHSAAKRSKLTDEGITQLILDFHWLAKRENLEWASRKRGLPVTRRLSRAALLTDHYNISEKSLYRQVGYSKTRPTLGALPRPGRPRQADISPTKTTYTALKAASDETGGRLSNTKLAKKLKGKTPNWKTTYTKHDKRTGKKKKVRKSHPSRQTIERWQKEGTIQFERMRVIPQLSAEAVAERKEFTANHKDRPRFLDAHLDESVVRYDVENLAHGRGIMSICPAQKSDDGTDYESNLAAEFEKRIVRNADHDHPAQVLIFGAITQPQPRVMEAPLDFAEAKHPVLCVFNVKGQRKRVVMRTGKDGVVRGPGTEHEFTTKPITINGIVYRELIAGEGGLLDCIEQREAGGDVADRIKEFFIPIKKDDTVDTEELERRHQERVAKQNARATRKTRPVSMFLSHIQEDGAPGHGYNNRAKSPDKRETDMHKSLREYCESRGYTLYKQPRLSPDTNALDVGAWCMWKRRVMDQSHKIKLPDSYDKSQTERQLWDVLKEEVAKTEPAKFFNIFEQQRANVAAIAAVGGRELKVQPHTGIREKWGTYSVASSDTDFDWVSSDEAESVE